MFYSYKIVSYNSKGKTSSNYTKAIISNTTLPESLSPFTADQINSTVVRLDWLPVPMSSRSKHDGSMPSLTSSVHGFRILRNSTPVTQYLVEPSVTSFYDFSNEFLPNQIYEYKIIACTSSDCGAEDAKNSLRVLIKTKNESPLTVSAPRLAKFSETSALLDAKDCIIVRSPQTQPIVELRFYVYELLVYRGSQTQFELRDLKPFTTYSITLEACTYLPGTYLLFLPFLFFLKYLKWLYLNLNFRV